MSKGTAPTNIYVDPAVIFESALVPFYILSCAIAPMVLSTYALCARSPLDRGAAIFVILYVAIDTFPSGAVNWFTP